MTEQQFSRFQAGDKTEFKRVYDQYVGLMIYVARRCGLSDDEALDVVQESFLTLYKNTASIETPSGLKYWLVTTARNKSLDLIHKLRTEQRQLGSLAAEYATRQGPNSMPGAALIPEALLRELEVKLLGEVLDVIEREVNDDTLTLFYKQGLSAKQIAEVKGEPVSTVTNRISRSRKKFRETIKSHLQALRDNLY